MDQVPGAVLEPTTLTPEVRNHLGALLKQVFAPRDAASGPEVIAALFQRLEAALSAHGESIISEMRDGLLENLPGPRAFAMSLTRNQSAADDLVQATTLRACTNRDKYQPGTKLAAWLFTIMRNAFYSEHRRTQLEVEDPDDSFLGRASVALTQGHGLDVADMWRAMGQLPPAQRDALVLIALQNLSYDDAAMVLGCKAGTIKSRVSRGRQRLSEALAHASDDYGTDGQTMAVLGATHKTPPK